MTASSDENDTSSLDRVAELAQQAGIRIGVAESLTGGRLSSRLASGDDASQWFRGSVAAYSPEVKFELLGVDPGPVNTLGCACQLAQGAVRVLGADVAVAATGVGGPGPDEGVPAGTVYLACADWTGEVTGCERHFDGPPSVVDSTVDACLALLLRCLDPDAPDGRLVRWRDCHRV